MYRDLYHRMCRLLQKKSYLKTVGIMVQRPKRDLYHAQRRETYVLHMLNLLVYSLRWTDCHSLANEERCRSLLKSST